MVTMDRTLFIHCIVIILFTLKYTGAIDVPLFKDISLEQGVVRGFRKIEKKYFEFLGIPYAAAPTGINRFKAPMPPKNWAGIFYANQTIMCPQHKETNEDCLVINIYAPAKYTKSLSVLVYIHGGAFLFGDGIRNSRVDHLIDQDIIVVTFNYRLGALGFLCLGTDEVPGNAGMKDQIEALKWVKKNIRYFGGDSSNVTISGTSAGGTSTELLVISPLATGLFKNAIVESGSALTVWAIDFEPIETAKRVALSMGHKANDIIDLVDFYYKIDVSTLNYYTSNYYESRLDGTFGFVPCIEKAHDEAFLSEDPLSLIGRGQFEHVPILYIFVNGEGFFREQEFYKYNKDMNKDFSKFLPADLNFSSESVKYKVSNATKTFYFDNETISEKTIINYLNYFGDSLFIYPIINSCKNIVRQNSKAVYLLEFAYDGGLNDPKPVFSNISAASHHDSVNYVFANADIANDVDRNIVDIMVGIWSTFMKHGTPNYLNWTPVTVDNITYFKVGNDTVMLKEPYRNRIHFWDDLYSRYRRKLTPIQKTGVHNT